MDPFNITLNMDNNQVRELIEIVKYEQEKPEECTLYFEFLVKYKAKSGIYVISDISFGSLYSIKPQHYYTMLSFKTFFLGGGTLSKLL